MRFSPGLGSKSDLIIHVSQTSLNPFNGVSCFVGFRWNSCFVLVSSSLYRCVWVEGCRRRRRGRRIVEVLWSGLRVKIWGFWGWNECFKVHQVRHCRGWCRWQNLSPYLLYQQHFPHGESSFPISRVSYLGPWRLGALFPSGWYGRNFLAFRRSFGYWENEGKTENVCSHNGAKYWPTLVRFVYEVVSWLEMLIYFRIVTKKGKFFM